MARSKDSVNSRCCLLSPSLLSLLLLFKAEAEGQAEAGRKLYP